MIFYSFCYPIFRPWCFFSFVLFLGALRWWRYLCQLFLRHQLWFISFRFMFVNVGSSFSRCIDLFLAWHFVTQPSCCFVEVIWGHASDEVARAAAEDLTAVEDELRNNQTKRWQAFGMLKHILASVALPWELKKNAIDFLLSIRGGNISPCDEHNDISSDMPGLFAVLQVVSCAIIIYSSIFFFIKKEENLIYFISVMLHFRLFKWSSCIHQIQCWGRMPLMYLNGWGFELLLPHGCYCPIGYTQNSLAHF